MSAELLAELAHLFDVEADAQGDDEEFVRLLGIARALQGDAIARETAA